MEELKTIKFEVGQIETNLDDVETAVKASLKKYQDLVIEEKDLPDAKKSRADLNGLSTSINNWRLNKEREFMAPFQPKKEQCNRIIGLIKDCSSQIDTQVKEYESKADAAKRQQIEEYWKSNGSTKSIPLDKVWNKKFLNKTCSESQWKKELDDRRERIAADTAGFAKMIDPAYPEATEWLMQRYLEDLDFGKTLADWEHYKENKRRAQELQEEMAAEKAKKKAAETIVLHNEEPLTPVKEVDQAASQTAPDENGATYWAEFRIEGATKQQMIDLTHAISNIGLAMHVLRDSNGNLRKGH